MVMVVQCLLNIHNPTAFPSPGSQEQILPNMVSSSTDLHHRVADINKGDLCWHGSSTQKVPAIPPPCGLNLLKPSSIAHDYFAEEFRSCF